MGTSQNVCSLDKIHQVFRSFKLFTRRNTIILKIQCIPDIRSCALAAPKTGMWPAVLTSLGTWELSSWLWLRHLGVWKEEPPYRLEQTPLGLLCTLSKITGTLPALPCTYPPLIVLASW